MNRNQIMLIGLVLLLLGFQLRMVDSFVLKEESARFFAESSEPAEVASMQSMPLAITGSIPTSRRTVEPPRWLGWSMLSIGGVLVLQSLAMRKTGG